MESSNKPRFLDWSVSATGQWSGDEMEWLRDANPSEMVEPLWDLGKGVQSYALFELVAHANYKKAAILARALAQAHPECRNSISENVGVEMAKILFESNLLTLPSKPSDIKSC